MVKVKGDNFASGRVDAIGFNHPMVKVKVVEWLNVQLYGAKFQPPYGES